MAVMPPQRFTARLEDRIVHNDKFVQYTFELVSPHLIQFAAGQYVSMKVSERGERRSYSICSPPGVQHSFELLVDISPQGIGSLYIESLKLGDEVDVLAPMGVFTLASSGVEQSLAFVATGSGITPFRSMILHLLQEQLDTRPITLYWGLRYAQDLFWQNDFQDLAEAFPNFKFHPVLSKAADEWPLCRGRVTDCLAVHGVPPNTGFYICGNEHMVKDTIQLLQQGGVSETFIHHEKFY